MGGAGYHVQAGQGPIKGMNRARRPRARLPLLAVAALGAVALALLLAAPSSASLTPPASGDWTILSFEDASLEGTSTVVTGNITVQGTLYVGNGSLLLYNGGQLFVPRISLAPGAGLSLFNATLAGQGAVHFVLEAAAGSHLTADTAAISGLDELSVGSLSGVGMALHGANADLRDVVISNSVGGIGLDQGSSLTGTNLNFSVSKRALYLAGAASANLTAFIAAGNPAASDFLVVVDQSSLALNGGNLSMAQVGLLVLSGTAVAQAMDVGPIEDIGVLSVGSTVNWTGGKVAPARNDSEGFEAYGSSLNISTSVYNATFGAVLIESQATFWNFSFEASGGIPKGSTAAVYAFDSRVAVYDSNISGRYWVANFPLFYPNGTPVLDPITGQQVINQVYSCATSALWAVHSTVSVVNTTTFCFNTHIWSVDTATQLDHLDLTNGTTGVLIQGGSVSGGDIVGRLFNNSGKSGLLVAFYKNTGSLSGVESFGNDAAVEFTGSDGQIDGLTVHAPGVSVRVWSGAPTVNASTLYVENQNGTEILGGNPTISNTTIHLTSTVAEARAMSVIGGRPTMYRTTVDGNYQFSVGVVTQATSQVTVRESTFTHLERAGQMYALDFLIEGNRVDRCYVGFEAGEGAAGTVAGNLFTNMTDLGLGFPIRMVKAAVVVEGNTVIGANYGVQITYHNMTGSAITRISSNTFDTIRWFAIQALFSTRAILIENNTIRNTTYGAIELVRAPASSAYNVIFDGDSYGYSVNASALTIVGDRLENISRAVDIGGGSVDVQFSTFARNGLGIYAADAAVHVHNSSFQFNGIAIEILNSVPNEVIDTLFVNNGDSIYQYGYGTLELRDSSFIGTVGKVLSNEQYTSASITFTRRGEISGGHILLNGMINSTADALTLRTLEMKFGAYGGGPRGLSIVGAQDLVMEDVTLTDAVGAFSFEVRNSTGSMALLTSVGASARDNATYEGPYFENSQITMRDAFFNRSDGNFTLRYSALTASNLTLRDMNGTSLTLVGSTLNLTNAAILDGAGCGIDARASSVLDAVNLTVRGNDGGSLCFSASRATVVKGDFDTGGARDVVAQAGSDLLLVSTLIARTYSVLDTSRLTIAWVLQVKVSYANPGLLGLVSVTIQDARGALTSYHPNATGMVEGIPYLAERIISATSTVVRSPYTVGAGYGPLSANANVTLDRDRSIELSLNDTTAPTVTITAPTAGSFFNFSSINFSFQASDSGSGIRDLIYRFGAGSSVALDPSAGSYNISRVLVDGVHTFTVRAQDFQGNIGEASVNFTVDTLDPLITVVAPKGDPYKTRAASVTVQVALDSDVANLTIGGTEVPVASGGASLVLDLAEGQTTIQVVATDRAGNIARVNVSVVSDRTAPALTITNRLDGNLTAESYIIVRGSTEPGALVVVQGYPVATDNGSFEALVYLDVGANEIEVHARDALGNENSTRLTVSRGVLEPSHLLDTVVTVIGVVLLLVAAAVAFLTLRRGMQPPPTSGPASGRPPP